MSKLKERLSVLKIEKLMGNIKGISSVLLFLEKPKEISWYSGQLNHLDNNIPRICHLSSDVDIKHLAKIIESQVGNERCFIMMFFEFVPVYVSFCVSSFYEFLNSFYIELNTKDITLFFLNEEKVLDIFLDEYELEVKILDNEAK